MEWNIYEQGETIGTLTAEQDGLFLRFFCRITQQPERLRRVFALSGWEAEYLGIPGPDGILHAQIPSAHLPAGVSGAAASVQPRGQWVPWCGALDGVMLTDAMLLHTAEGMTLALPPETMLSFPAWAGQAEPLYLCGRDMAALPLSTNGDVLLRDTDGGNENETDAVPDFGTGLPDDPAAGDGFGSTDEKTDCSDL